MTRIVVLSSPVEVPFNSKNDVTELGVEPKLAASDEYAAAASIIEVQAEAVVDQVTVEPSASEVAAEIEARPSENWRRWW
jgi:hypothetical protein